MLQLNTSACENRYKYMRCVRRLSKSQLYSSQIYYTTGTNSNGNLPVSGSSLVGNFTFTPYIVKYFDAEKDGDWFEPLRL